MAEPRESTTATVAKAGASAFSSKWVLIAGGVLVLGVIVLLTKGKSSTTETASAGTPASGVQIGEGVPVEVPAAVKPETPREELERRANAVEVGKEELKDVREETKTLKALTEAEREQREAKRKHEEAVNKAKEREKRQEEKTKERERREKEKAERQKSREEKRAEKVKEGGSGSSAGGAVRRVGTRERAGKSKGTVAKISGPSASRVKVQVHRRAA